MPVIQCNGADCYYETDGDGDAVVFLHGAWVSLRYFAPQLRGLADEYHTVAFDYRGHGRSEKTEAGHTVPQYARDLDALLEALGLDDVVLVGWSLGALVAWDYVDQFGTDRVRALVDVDMEPSPGDWSADAGGRYDAERLRRIHEATQSDHWGLVEEMREDLLKDPPSPDLAAMMYDEATRCPPSIKSSIILDAATRDYRDVLADLDVPILVLAGVDEKWRTVAAVERGAELAPDATFELFAESGHCLTVEEPERFNRVVRGFLDSL